MDIGLGRQTNTGAGQVARHRAAGGGRRGWTQGLLGLADGAREEH
jgi:hypothetical protein